MSNKPSKTAEERTTSSKLPTPSLQRIENPTTRKRSDTKHGNQPPAIHLSLKSSASGSSYPNPYDAVDLSYSPSQPSSSKSSSGLKKVSPAPSSPSTPSPSTGRSAGYSSHKSSSPAGSSPHRSLFSGDTYSSSLPTTLSPLSTDTSMDFVAPLPSPHSPVSSSRRPSYTDKSLSSFSHGQSGLSSQRSNNNLRVAASRMPSDPASRKSSITSMERDAGMHLDMKRLLSRPGAPSHSGSDSEPPRSPRLPPTMSRQPSSQHIGSSGAAPLTKERSAMARRATDDGSAGHALRKSASKASLHTTIQAPPKPRNVLRRKASALSNPATPTAQSFQAQQQPSPQSVSRSSSKSAAPRRTTSAIAEPVVVAGMRRTASPPPNLTPAGAVAHAYKQQEQRRSELAEISGWDEQLARPRLEREKSADSRGTFLDEDEEGSGTFYTVFGGSAGRVVAVGSAEDATWDLDPRVGADDRFKAPTRTSSGHSVSAVRGLGRKVSGRFKRSGSGTMGREHVRGGRQVDEPFDGRPPSRTASLSRPLGPSLDGFVDVRTQASSGSSIPSLQNGTPERKDREPRPLRTMRSLIGKDQHVDKQGAEEGSSGGKLWKLMKRISTGALRDKYQDTTPPPPVPALPDSYKNMAASRTTFDIRKGRDDSSETGITRFMHSRTSMSAVRPATAPQKSSPRSEQPGSRPSTGPRPSTTTRSSSPMSSEVASSRFFHKSHSTHSSISSYGEELPPLPNPNSSNTNVGQHIMTPGELYSKLSKDFDESSKKPRQRSRSRTQSLGVEDAPRPVSEIRPSLPPPRRSNTAGSKPAIEGDSEPPSPLIPAFETAEPTNHFAAMSASRYSLPMSEFGVPSDGTLGRPRRSSRRKPPPFDLASTSDSTATAPRTPRTPRSPNVPSINIDVRGTDRKSIASASMHSTIHESASPSSAGAASNSRSPLRFREMDSPRVPLSEREKAAKWDDLLLRSEQAGGTLHLGDSGLMSDNVRFSDYSGSDT